MYLLLLMILPLIVASPVNGPELFGTHQKESKLIVKNHIGYHFKKVVREVSQELFVSRQIDVSSLFLGLRILDQTHQDLHHHCGSMSLSTSSLSMSITKLRGDPSTQRYTLISHPPKASFMEAKSRCHALGMQLPEVYDKMQIDLLSTFLRANHIPRCFAGLEPDLADAIFRFVATGFPIWRTPHTEIYDHNGKKANTILTKMDDFFTKWLYGDDGKLYYHESYPAVQFDTKQGIGDPNYRNTATNFSQTIGPIVCERKWDGTDYDYFQPTSRTVQGIGVQSKDMIGNKAKRSVQVDLDGDLFLNKTESEVSLRSKKDDTRHPRSQATDLDTLREYCMSVSSQALDMKAEMMLKIQDVLSLADISFHMENNAKKKRSPLAKARKRKRSPLGKTRKKRFFLAKIAFKMGFGLIWNLFGFAQKVSDYKQQKKMKKGIAANKKSSAENREAIQEMSRAVLSHSVSIDQLKITTQDLERRIGSLETKVGKIQDTISNITHKLDTVIEISLISSLISRIQQSMNSGYDVLKDIIHCSLLGQTSPLLLPLDQIMKVQNEVRRVSDALLDTDFLNMQSIVVSDPMDPGTLLVVINVAALSRKSVELVKLVPIPSYENGKTFIPVLDYTTIVLDQSAYTYSILTPREEQDCISSRCYVQDTERPISQKTCGIPQFYDQQMEACLFEETQSNGIFLKSMLPDGVFFAFRTEVNSQLFCNNNKDIGTMKKLSGLGVMQLPNGCTLSVTDSSSLNTKVKGPAMYRMIDADDLTLILNGPVGSILTDKGNKATNKASTYEGLLASQLDPVIHQMSAANVRIAKTHTIMWILVSLAIITIVIVAIVVAIYCRHYFKIFAKIYALRTKVSELVQLILNLTHARETFGNMRARIQALNPLPRIPRSRLGRNFLSHLHTRHHAVKHEEGSKNDIDLPSSPSAYVSLQELNTEQREERTYVNFKSIPNRDSDSAPESYRHTLPRHYPRLSPMLAEMRAGEMSEEALELNKESSEVEELCQRKFFPPGDYSKS